MEPRLRPSLVAPEGFRAMLALERYVKASGLEESLTELVRIRASQINSCAYCIDLHAKNARDRGETEQRIYALSAWRETPFFTDRERAALEWTEAVTLIQNNNIPDSLYEATRAYFSEKELVDLTMVVIEINGFNRLTISFRSVPGTYQAKMVQAIVDQA